MSNDRQRDLLLEKWKLIEKNIVADSDHAYNLEWGAQREEFYNENNYIPCSSADVGRLSALKGVFKGERIFVLGNGPSLNQTPLEFLKDEFTFVTNRIYLLFDRIDWRPTFYTATDWRVIPDIAHEINLLTGMIFFFEERFRGLLREDDDDIYWHTHNGSIDPGEKIFAYDITKGVRGAGSVTGTAIQIAFYLGFSPIYLIGCDLGYKVGETVKQEGPDKFGTGTKLYLTSMEDDDFSHFDKRYFGQGRRWHDPNEKRIIEGHRQCREGIEKADGKIYNATIGGDLDVYERVDFKSLFPRPKHMVGKQLLQKIRKPLEVTYPVPEPWKDNCLLGPFARCEHANISETQIVFNLLKNTEAGVMVDVGAHHGGALLPFAQNGWCVYAFEPDAKNREALEKKISAFPNITVHKRAVSNTTARTIPFYSSPESTGVSCLKPFLNSHSESDTIDTVTLTDWCREQKLSSIDFLKIDTEGFDLMVLKGLPWDRVKPNVIVCEYEDNKTRELGYTMHDMASYLIDHGYELLVSEWYPIIHYGIKHDWHRLVPYSGKLDNENTWGNLIAFRDLPNFRQISTIAKRVVNVDDVQVPAKVAQHKFDDVQIPVKVAPHKVDDVQISSKDTSLYQRLFGYLDKHYPTIITIGRFGKWNLTQLKNMLFGIGGISLLVIIALYISGGLSESLRWPLVGAATVLFILLSGLMALSYAKFCFNSFITSQRLEMKAIAESVNPYYWRKPTQAQTIPDTMKKDSLSYPDFPALINRLLDEREKQARWRKIKGLYKDQRAFLIGNGPSLNKTPLHLLKNEFTLCFNRFDLMFDRLGWKPSMYMCVDDRVAGDTASLINEIVPLVSFAFFPDEHPVGMDFRSFINDADNVFWLSTVRNGFYKDLPHCGLGGTVAHVGLQVLAFMGFSPIYLVGVDMDYKDHATAIKRDKYQWTSVKDDDPNHFDPRYFGAGTKYHYPTLHEDMLPSLQRAKEYLDADGIKVLNAGIGGSLEIFPRIDFRSLFNFEEDVEVKMLLSAINPELHRDALQTLRSGKIVEARDDWDEKSPFAVTTLQLGEQLIHEVIFTHIPYGPFGNRYLFMKRDKVSSVVETATAELKKKTEA